VIAGLVEAWGCSVNHGSALVGLTRAAYIIESLLREHCVTVPKPRPPTKKEVPPARLASP
jgi:hypothetical protein